jgi:hypothetical protein
LNFTNDRRDVFREAISISFQIGDGTISPEPMAGRFQRGLSRLSTMVRTS